MSLPEGKGTREWASFREGREVNTSVCAITNETRSYPHCHTVTASGETVLIAGRADVALVVTGFHFSKYGGSQVNVSLRAGSGKEDLFLCCLKTDGENLHRDLQGGWKLPVNTSLIANLSGAGNIYIEVETADDTVGEEAKDLTDTISIAEALVPVTEYHAALTDSQAIADNASAAPVSEFVRTAADAQTIADSDIIITGDRFKTLGDSVALTDSVGNHTDTALSEADSLTIAATVQVTLIPG